MVVHVLLESCVEDAEAQEHRWMNLVPDRGLQMTPTAQVLHLGLPLTPTAQTYRIELQLAPTVQIQCHKLQVASL